MAQGLPGNHHPPELQTLVAPRLIELCFQTAALWDVVGQGRMGLPEHVHQVSVWRSPDLAEGPLYAVATPNPDDGSFEAEVVDTAGNRYVHLRGYRTVAHPEGIDPESLKALRPVVDEEHNLVSV